MLFNFNVSSKINHFNPSKNYSLAVGLLEPLRSLILNLILNLSS